ncbi:centromere protein F-like [Pleurodeles waltl]|uniref:centromere protein F-like n=1 Tax=Pleurodeles waltl TaxID=8319 RepID=UPI003709A112
MAMTKCHLGPLGPSASWEDLAVSVLLDLQLKQEAELRDVIFDLAEGKEEVLSDLYVKYVTSLQNQHTLINLVHHFQQPLPQDRAAPRHQATTVGEQNEIQGVNSPPLGEGHRGEISGGLTVSEDVDFQLTEVKVIPGQVFLETHSEKSNVAEERTEENNALLTADKRSPDELEKAVLEATDTLIGGLLSLKDKVGRVLRRQSVKTSDPIDVGANLIEENKSADCVDSAILEQRSVTDTGQRLQNIIHHSINSEDNNVATLGSFTRIEPVFIKHHPPTQHLEEEVNGTEETHGAGSRQWDAHSQETDKELKATEETCSFGFKGLELPKEQIEKEVELNKQTARPESEECIPIGQEIEKEKEKAEIERIREWALTVWEEAEKMMDGLVTLREYVRSASRQRSAMSWNRDDRNGNGQQLQEEDIADETKVHNPEQLSPAETAITEVQEPENIILDQELEWPINSVLNRDHSEAKCEKEDLLAGEVTEDEFIFGNIASESEEEACPAQEMDVKEEVTKMTPGTDSKDQALLVHRIEEDEEEVTGRTPGTHCKKGFQLAERAKDTKEDVNEVTIGTDCSESSSQILREELEEEVTKVTLGNDHNTNSPILQNTDRERVAIEETSSPDSEEEDASAQKAENEEEMTDKTSVIDSTEETSSAQEAEGENDIALEEKKSPTQVMEEPFKDTSRMTIAGQNMQAQEMEGHITETLYNNCELNRLPVQGMKRTVELVKDLVRPCQDLQNSLSLHGMEGEKKLVSETMGDDCEKHNLSIEKTNIVTEDVANETTGEYCEKQILSKPGNKEAIGESSRAKSKQQRYMKQREESQEEVNNDASNSGYEEKDLSAQRGDSGVTGDLGRSDFGESYQQLQALIIEKDPLSEQTTRQMSGERGFTEQTPVGNQRSRECNYLPLQLMERGDELVKEAARPSWERCYPPEQETEEKEKTIGNRGEGYDQAKLRKNSKNKVPEVVMSQVSDLWNCLGFKAEDGSTYESWKPGCEEQGLLLQAVINNSESKMKGHVLAVQGFTTEEVTERNTCVGGEVSNSLAHQFEEEASEDSLVQGCGGSCVEVQRTVKEWTPIPCMLGNRESMITQMQELKCNEVNTNESCTNLKNQCLLTQGTEKKEDVTEESTRAKCNCLVLPGQWVMGEKEGTEDISRTKCCEHDLSSQKTKKVSDSVPFCDIQEYCLPEEGEETDVKITKTGYNGQDLSEQGIEEEVIKNCTFSRFEVYEPPLQAIGGEAVTTLIHLRKINAPEHITGKEKELKTYKVALEEKSPQAERPNEWVMTEKSSLPCHKEEHAPAQGAKELADGEPDSAAAVTSIQQLRVVHAEWTMLSERSESQQQKLESASAKEANAAGDHGRDQRAEEGKPESLKTMRAGCEETEQQGKDEHAEPGETRRTGCKASALPAEGEEFIEKGGTGYKQREHPGEGEHMYHLKLVQVVCEDREPQVEGEKWEPMETLKTGCNEVKPLVEDENGEPMEAMGAECKDSGHPAESNTEAMEKVQTQYKEKDKPSAGENRNPEDMTEHGCEERALPAEGENGKAMETIRTGCGETDPLIYEWKVGHVETLGIRHRERRPPTEEEKADSLEMIQNQSEEGNTLQGKSGEQETVQIKSTGHKAVGIVEEDEAKMDWMEKARCEENNSPAKRAQIETLKNVGALCVERESLREGVEAETTKSISTETCSSEKEEEKETLETTAYTCEKLNLSSLAAESLAAEEEMSVTVEATMANQEHWGETVKETASKESGTVQPISSRFKQRIPLELREYDCMVTTRSVQVQRDTASEILTEDPEKTGKTTMAGCAEWNLTAHGSKGNNELRVVHAEWTMLSERSESQQQKLESASAKEANAAGDHGRDQRAEEGKPESLKTMRAGCEETEQQGKDEHAEPGETRRTGCKASALPAEGEEFIEKGGTGYKQREHPGEGEHMYHLKLVQVVCEDREPQVEGEKWEPMETLKTGCNEVKPLVEDENGEPMEAMGAECKDSGHPAESNTEAMEKVQTQYKEKDKPSAGENRNPEDMTEHGCEERALPAEGENGKAMETIRTGCGETDPLIYEWKVGHVETLGIRHRERRPPTEEEKADSLEMIQNQSEEGNTLQGKSGEQETVQIKSTGHKAVGIVEEDEAKMDWMEKARCEENNSPAKRAQIETLKNVGALCVERESLREGVEAETTKSISTETCSSEKEEEKETLETTAYTCEKLNLSSLAAESLAAEEEMSVTVEATMANQEHWGETVKETASKESGTVQPISSRFKQRIPLELREYDCMVTTRSVQVQRDTASEILTEDPEKTGKTTMAGCAEWNLTAHGSKGNNELRVVHAEWTMLSERSESQQQKLESASAKEANAAGDHGRDQRAEEGKPESLKTMRAGCEETEQQGKDEHAEPGETRRTGCKACALPAEGEEFIEKGGTGYKQREHPGEGEHMYHLKLVQVGCEDREPQAEGEKWEPLETLKTGCSEVKPLVEDENREPMEATGAECKDSGHPAESNTEAMEKVRTQYKEKDKPPAGENGNPEDMTEHGCEERALPAEGENGKALETIRTGCGETDPLIYEWKVGLVETLGIRHREKRPPIEEEKADSLEIIQNQSEERNTLQGKSGEQETVQIKSTGHKAVGTVEEDEAKMDWMEKASCEENNSPAKRAQIETLKNVGALFVERESLREGVEAETTKSISTETCSSEKEEEKETLETTAYTCEKLNLSSLAAESLAAEEEMSVTVETTMANQEHWGETVKETASKESGTVQPISSRFKQRIPLELREYDCMVTTRSVQVERDTASEILTEDPEKTGKTTMAGCAEWNLTAHGSKGNNEAFHSVRSLVTFFPGNRKVVAQKISFPTKSGFVPCRECEGQMSITDHEDDCLQCLSSDRDINSCFSCQKMNPKALK